LQISLYVPIIPFEKKEKNIPLKNFQKKTVQNMYPKNNEKKNRFLARLYHEPKVSQVLNGKPKGFTELQSLEKKIQVSFEKGTEINLQTHVRKFEFLLLNQLHSAAFSCYTFLN